MENMDHDETPMELEENKQETENKEENFDEEMVQGWFILTWLNLNLFTYLTFQLISPLFFNIHVDKKIVN